MKSVSFFRRIQFDNKKPRTDINHVNLQNQIILPIGYRIQLYIKEIRIHLHTLYIGLSSVHLLLFADCTVQVLFAKAPSVELN